MAGSTLLGPILRIIAHPLSFLFNHDTKLLFRLRAAHIVGLSFDETLPLETASDAVLLNLCYLSGPQVTALIQDVTKICADSFLISCWKWLYHKTNGYIGSDLTDRLSNTKLKADTTIETARHILGQRYPHLLFPKIDPTLLPIMHAIQKDSAPQGRAQPLFHCPEWYIKGQATFIRWGKHALQIIGVTLTILIGLFTVLSLSWWKIAFALALFYLPTLIVVFNYAYVNVRNYFSGVWKQEAFSHYHGLTPLIAGLEGCVLFLIDAPLTNNSLFPDIENILATLSEQTRFYTRKLLSITSLPKTSRQKIIDTLEVFLTESGVKIKNRKQDLLHQLHNAFEIFCESGNSALIPSKSYLDSVRAYVANIESLPGTALLTGGGWVASYLQQESYLSPLSQVLPEMFPQLGFNSSHYANRLTPILALTENPSAYAEALTHLGLLLQGQHVPSLAECNRINQVLTDNLTGTSETALHSLVFKTINARTPTSLHCLSKDHQDKLSPFLTMTRKSVESLSSWINVCVKSNTYTHFSESLAWMMVFHETIYLDVFFQSAKDRIFDILRTIQGLPNSELIPLLELLMMPPQSAMPPINAPAIALDVHSQFSYLFQAWKCIFEKRFFYALTEHAKGNPSALDFNEKELILLKKLREEEPDWDWKLLQHSSLFRLPWSSCIAKGLDILYEKGVVTFSVIEGYFGYALKMIESSFDRKTLPHLPDFYCPVSIERARTLSLGWANPDLLQRLPRIAHLLSSAVPNLAVTSNKTTFPLNALIPSIVSMTKQLNQSRDHVAVPCTLIATPDMLRYRERMLRVGLALQDSNHFRKFDIEDLEALVMSIESNDSFQDFLAQAETLLRILPHSPAVAALPKWMVHWRKCIESLKSPYTTKSEHPYQYCIITLLAQNELNEVQKFQALKQWLPIIRRHPLLEWEDLQHTSVGLIQIIKSIGKYPVELWVRKAAEDRDFALMLLPISAFLPHRSSIWYALAFWYFWENRTDAHTIHPNATPAIYQSIMGMWMNEWFSEKLDCIDKAGLPYARYQSLKFLLPESYSIEDRKETMPLLLLGNLARAIPTPESLIEQSSFLGTLLSPITAPIQALNMALTNFLLEESPNAPYSSNKMNSEIYALLNSKISQLPAIILGKYFSTFHGNTVTTTVFLKFPLTLFGYTECFRALLISELRMPVSYELRDYPALERYLLGCFKVPPDRYNKPHPAKAWGLEYIIDTILTAGSLPVEFTNLPTLKASIPFARKELLLPNMKFTLTEDLHLLREQQRRFSLIMLYHIQQNRTVLGGFLALAAQRGGVPLRTIRHQGVTQYVFDTTQCPLDIMIKPEDRRHLTGQHLLIMPEEDAFTLTEEEILPKPLQLSVFQRAFGRVQSPERKKAIATTKAQCPDVLEVPVDTTGKTVSVKRQVL